MLEQNTVTTHAGTTATTQAESGNTLPPSDWGWSLQENRQLSRVKSDTTPSPRHVPLHGLLYGPLGCTALPSAHLAVDNHVPKHAHMINLLKPRHGWVDGECIWY